MYSRLSVCIGTLLLLSSTVVSIAPAAAKAPQVHSTTAVTASVSYGESFPDKHLVKRLAVSVPAPTPAPKPAPVRRTYVAPSPAPTPTPAPTPAPAYTPPPSGSPQDYARVRLGETEFECFNSIVERESGWDIYATNPTSGAYGIMQALPGSKMASAGADWQTDGVTQVRWGISYLDSTYGSPCDGWAHERADGWY